MVDWSLARQVARLSAGADEAPEAGLDLAAVCKELEPHVAGYTGLEPTTPVPPPEMVSRAEWASANLESLSDLLDPVAERLDRRLSFAGPLAGALRVGAAATVAAEAGLVMGYVSQRVLGQYDVSLLGGGTALPGFCSWRRTSRRRWPSSRWSGPASSAGSAPTSSRTSSSSRACPGCGSTWDPFCAAISRRSRCGSTAGPRAGCRPCRARPGWWRPSARAAWSR